MKPILFPANATSFTTNGIGRLDPTSCVVTEERNGQYELECVVPVESPHFEDIANNMILAVSPSDGATLQAFRIYQITEPLNGLVTLAARHISYDLSYNSVMPFTAGSCSAALTGLSTYSVETQPFSFWTDKSVVADFAVKVPQAVRSCLGGQQGSILDVYGGVYEWDNWTVKLWTRRGADNGVTLRYGKNITDLSQEQNLESVVTGIVPYWASENAVVTLPEKSVDSTYASSYPYKRTVPVDFSSVWTDAPTESQLRAKAQAYILANKIGVPKVSIKVSFVALWQTEEYKTVAPLERVKLCDTVHIIFERYGIDAVAEVVRTEYDCLNERYRSIELGEARANLASTLVSMNDQTNQALENTTSELQNAIDRATNIITGQNGGWIKIKSNANNQPYELLIMDDPDETQATKIWRWNIGGLGYSSTGYEGPFGLAMTMDGEIVANFITSGQMSANHVRTGLIQSEATQTGTSVPVSSWDLDSGKFKTTDGEFSGVLENTEVISSVSTRKVIITGSSIKSQSLFNGSVSQELIINSGELSAYKISADRATIQSVSSGASYGVLLDTGELKFLTSPLNNPHNVGRIYGNSLSSNIYQMLIDSLGADLYLVDNYNSGNMYIGDSNGHGFQHVYVNSPLYIDHALYTYNSAGLGDSNGYQVTLDGKTLTFKNGILVNVS